MKKGFPIRVPNPKISAKQNPPTWCLALLSLLWCSSLSCLLVGLCLPARAFAGALCAGWGLVLGLGVVVCAYLLLWVRGVRISVAMGGKVCAQLAGLRVWCAHNRGCLVARGDKGAQDTRENRTNTHGSGDY